VTRTIADEQSVAGQVLSELAPIIAVERAALAAGCHERAISIPHLQVMTILDAAGAMPMGHLADQLGSTLPTLTGLVSRMEQRGLVSRTHDQTDRRVVLVQLTPVGADQLRDLTGLRQQRMARAVALLSEPQQRELVSAFRNLRSAFEQAHLQGAPE
jgi:DNA-binding MarR family transcriptional regulator